MVSGTDDLPRPPKSAAAHRHRELVARSLDFAVESRSEQDRAEMLDIALQFDREASSIEAHARSEMHLPGRVD